MPGWGRSRDARRDFGQDDPESFLEAHEAQGVVQAYAAWGVLDYRPTVRSKTHAEKMLESGLPEAEEIHLRARAETRPTRT